MAPSLVECVLVVSAIAACGTSAAKRTTAVEDTCSAARTRTSRTVAEAHLAVDHQTVLAQFDTCWAGWAASLDAICEHRMQTSDGTVAVVGRWQVVYGARDGSVATHSRGGTTDIGGACVDRDHPGNIVSDGYTTLARIEAPQLFDYDGDGVPEILLVDTHRAITVESSGETRLRAERTSELLTYKRRVISRYAPALALPGVTSNGIVAMRDVDHDGRPDLELVFNGPVPGSVPHRIAHSLADGTFSETDAVARRALLAQCSDKADLLVTHRDGTIDDDASFAAIACAALRGERGRDITARLGAMCAHRPQECLRVERWAGEMYLYGVGGM